MRATILSSVTGASHSSCAQSGQLPFVSSFQYPWLEPDSLLPLLIAEIGYEPLAWTEEAVATASKARLHCWTAVLAGGSGTPGFVHEPSPS